MKHLDMIEDLIKAEQDIWFALADINNDIRKLEANHAHKDDIIEVKKLHAQTYQLANKIKQTTLKFENEAIYE